MKQTGRYKLTHQRRGRLDAGPLGQPGTNPAGDGPALPAAMIGTAMRAQRIVDSLRAQIAATEGTQLLRVRQIFSTPREIYRLEYEVPDMSYQRTTLLDRDALEELLEDDRVRELISRGLGPDPAEFGDYDDFEDTEKQADAL